MAETLLLPTCVHSVLGMPTTEPQSAHLELFWVPTTCLPAPPALTCCQLPQTVMLPSSWTSPAAGNVSKFGHLLLCVVSNSDMDQRTLDFPL